MHQISHQPANHLQLLIILFAKNRHMRPHDVEKLGDNRGDTAKMARPTRAAKRQAELLDFDKGLRSGRINFAD